MCNGGLKKIKLLHVLDTILKAKTIQGGEKRANGVDDKLRSNFSEECALILVAILWVRSFGTFISSEY